jgi:imidazolonepropionase-like amidohydrolase
MTHNLRSFRRPTWPWCSVLLLIVLLAAPGMWRPAAAAPADPPAIAIVGATVVDGTGAPPAVATVVIRGDRIAEVGPQVQPPPGARVVDAKGKTLLPGLFDLHTHVPYSGTSVAGDWAKHLKAYLYCGVTTVVDFGSYPEMFEPMRRLIAQGMAAPRLVLAARIVAPGGHGEEGGRGDYFSLEVQTPREARAAIRRLLPYKPDAIKAFNDGWRYGSAPDLMSMNEATLAALVDEAHKNGLPVLTHTVTLERAKEAARAGVDVIDHGIGNADADAEVADLIKAKGTVYVSTLAVYESRRPLPFSALEDAVVEPAVREAVMRTAEQRRGPRAEAEPAAPAAGPSPRDVRWQRLTHNAAALEKAGVTIGVGTDGGETNTFHGWATLREMELLVASGLTPMQAIQAATLNAARALHVEKERGSIAAGKLADLVLVDGSPQSNIADIEKVSAVFLGGQQVDRDTLARDIASPDLTPIPAIKDAALLDDFEGPSSEGPEYLRSRVGTLWVNTTDPGSDHSRMVFGRMLRAPGDHALSVSGRMSVGERAFVAVALPLSHGAIEPVDARQFHGVRFDVRGDGDYRLVVPTRTIRDNNFFQSPFQAGPAWQTVSVDFASLKQMRSGAAAWRGDDLLGLVFRIERRPGEFGWLELDNVRLY